MSMYRLHPLYEVPSPSVSTTMYHLHPLITSPDMSSQSQSKLPNDRRGRLYQRQMKLIDQLNTLLAATGSLADQAATSATSSSSSTAATKAATKAAPKMAKQGQIQSSTDAARQVTDLSVVVQCNPTDPPLATLFVAQHLQNMGLNVCICQHWHSSLGSAPQGFKSTSGCSNAYNLRLTLVWSDTKHTTGTVSAADGGSLLHDFNVARFLARSFSLLYPQSVEDIVSMEDLIDTALTFKKATSKDKKNALKSINMRIGKSGYLCGTDPSLADACLWAALYEETLVLPSNIKRWNEAMSQLKQANDVLALTSPLSTSNA
eukprot:m.48091 g.48091  ORF g.48091 m.48091 type:complete len:318 (+) comp12378_c0_seq1:319-1272(+)